MSANTSPGPATDAAGQAVLDPTKNVLQLVDAAIKRQDDLREMDHKAMRREMRVRAYYEGKLRDKESERLDAIRDRDVNAVAAAAADARATAQTLAQQVADTAEAARQAMAAAAVANATSLRAEIAPLQKDIADLRQSQYEGVGAKGQVTESQAKSSNQGLWIGLAISGVVMLFGFLSVLIAAGALAFALTR